MAGSSPSKRIGGIWRSGIVGAEISAERAGVGAAGFTGAVARGRGVSAAAGVVFRFRRILSDLTATLGSTALAGKGLANRAAFRALTGLDATATRLIFGAEVFGLPEVRAGIFFS